MKLCLMCNIEKEINTINWIDKEANWCRACIDADLEEVNKQASIIRAQRLQDVKDGKIQPIVPPMPEEGK